MMSNTIEAIHLLEDTLKILLSNYEFLKNENQILLQNNTTLHHQLLEKEQKLVDQKKNLIYLKLLKLLKAVVQIQKIQN